MHNFSFYYNFAEMLFEHFLSAFCPFDISEDRQKLLFFILFLPMYVDTITLLLCAVFTHRSRQTH